MKERRGGLRRELSMVVDRLDCIGSTEVNTQSWGTSRWEHVFVGMASSSS